jgi:hypothetical protein
MLASSEVILNMLASSEVILNMLASSEVILNMLASSEVILNKLASSAVDRRFKSRLGQTKEYKIVICCCSVKYSLLRSKSKNGLARNRDNVCEWNLLTDCCFCELAL